MVELSLHFAVVALCCIAMTGCDRSNEVPAITAAESLPGGATTVSLKPFPLFIRPVANLPHALKPDFYAGKALAGQPWIKAPATTTVRDGLGPVYNARTCLACHIDGGKGHMPKDGNEPLLAAFLRISLPGRDAVRGVVAEPVYGDQLQGQSVALFHQLRQSMAQRDGALREVPPEAYVYVDWQEREFTYPEGEVVSLRYPKVRIGQLGYGNLHPDTLMGIRNAPSILGVGLLELIDQADIDRLADPNDLDGDGISGRVNRVWDFELEKTVPGRFGLKANRPNVRNVTSAAFANDIGITNPLFPDQPCTRAQALCLATPTGADESGVELPAHLLDLVVNFTRNLGVPQRRTPAAEAVVRGRSVFYRTGCAGCHTPSYVTAASADFPHLGGQTIWPYTDLLLHDMGPELADHRPDYEASGSEWRTPPLWGAGLSAEVNDRGHYLHDGRAQTIEEAILWHGGEAQAVKQAFTELDKTERVALLQFVESL